MTRDSHDNTDMGAVVSGLSARAAVSHKAQTHTNTHTEQGRGCKKAETDVMGMQELEAVNDVQSYLRSLIVPPQRW